MKTSVLLAGLVALMTLMASASFGALSSIGPTGILNVPTAETVTAGGFEMLVAYDRPTVSDVDIEVFPVAALTYGFAHGEIGVSYFNVKGYTAVKSVNAKYILTPQGHKSPSIAAGAMYLSGNSAETDMYLVATYSLDQQDDYRASTTPWEIRRSRSSLLGLLDAIRVTGGVLYQKPDYSASSSNFTGMMGLEFGSPGKTTLGFDYIVDDIAAGSIFGATIRQPITHDITAQLGVGSHDRYYVGMTLKFGGK